MAVLKKVLVPNIGDAADVDVIEISVSVGDVVETDDTLITLESEKASMDIPSPYSGEVKSLEIKEGDKVSEGSLILTLSVDAENIDESTEEETESENSSEKISENKSQTIVEQAPESKKEVQTMEDADLYASPVVRRVAREFDIDLKNIKGTGRKGRITKEDLQNYVKAKVASGSGNGLNIIEMPDIDFTKYGEIETKPLSRIQKYSAANLHRNWVSIPHVTQFDEADITEM